MNNFLESWIQMNQRVLPQKLLIPGQYTRVWVIERESKERESMCVSSGRMSQARTCSVTVNSSPEFVLSQRKWNMPVKMPGCDGKVELNTHRYWQWGRHVDWIDCQMRVTLCEVANLVRSTPQLVLCQPGNVNVILDRTWRFNGALLKVNLISEAYRFCFQILDLDFFLNWSLLLEQLNREYIELSCVDCQFNGLLMTYVIGFTGSPGYISCQLKSKFPYIYCYCVGLCVRCCHSGNGLLISARNPDLSIEMMHWHDTLGWYLCWCWQHQRNKSGISQRWVVHIWSCFLVTMVE